MTGSRWQTTHRKRIVTAAEDLTAVIADTCKHDDEKNFRSSMKCLLESRLSFYQIEWLNEAITYAYKIGCRRGKP